MNYLQNGIVAVRGARCIGRHGLYMYTMLPRTIVTDLTEHCIRSTNFEIYS